MISFFLPSGLRSGFDGFSLVIALLCCTEPIVLLDVALVCFRSREFDRLFVTVFSVETHFPFSSLLLCAFWTSIVFSASVRLSFCRGATGVEFLSADANLPLSQ